MKRIIAAFDGLKYSPGTRDYAVNLVGLTKAHLAGVFLDDYTYTSYKVYDLLVNEGVSDKKLMQFEEKDKATREKAAADFEKACQKAKLEYSIQHDRNVAIRELLHESIYADLLVIDSKETLTRYDEKIPTRFIRDLLTDVQCPVLLVPPKFKPIEKIVLLYDGEPSSVHAVKMFSYLFEVMLQLPIEVLTVKGVANDLHVPNNKLMKAFIKRHFPAATFTVLKGLAETEIIHYLKNQKLNVMVVAGAYRRGLMSRWFRPSMADALMQELKAPLFIAHNK